MRRCIARTLAALGVVAALRLPPPVHAQVDLNPSTATPLASFEWHDFISSLTVPASSATYFLDFLHDGGVPHDVRYGRGAVDSDPCHKNDIIVEEPAALALFATGVIGVGVQFRRRKKT